MKLWITILLLLAGLNSCTTTGNTYNTSPTKEINFANYKTYKWLPKDSATITNVLYDNTLISTSVEGSTNKLLAAKGFKLMKDSADLLIQYTMVVENKSELVTSKNISSIPDPGPRNFYQPFNPYSPTSAYNGLNQYPGTYSPYDSPQSIYYYNNPGNMYTPGYYSNNYPYYSPYGFPYNGNNYIANDVHSINYKEGTLIIDFIDAKTKEIIWRTWNTEGLSDPNAYQKKIPVVIKEMLGEIPVQK